MKTKQIELTMEDLMKIEQFNQYLNNSNILLNPIKPRTRKIR